MTTGTLEQMAERLIIRPDPKPEAAEVTAEEQPEVEEEAEADEEAMTEAGDESAEEVETEEADEEEEVSAAPQKFRVKVDGRETEVSLEELTRSYSGQAYIQKGMQEAAAAKKAAQEQMQALQAAQQQVLSAAEALQQQGVIPMPKAPDPALAQTDFVKYTRERAKYETDLSAYNNQQSQIAAVKQMHEQSQQQAQQAYLEEQRSKMLEFVPELANPETAAKTREKLLNAGQQLGFSAEEIENVMDARAVHVLNLAAKYLELQSGTAKAKAEKRPPVTVKPKAKTPEPQQLARSKVVAQAKKSGRTEDWAKALLVPKQT